MEENLEKSFSISFRASGRHMEGNSNSLFQLLWHEGGKARRSPIRSRTRNYARRAPRRRLRRLTNENENNDAILCSCQSRVCCNNSSELNIQRTEASC